MALLMRGICCKEVQLLLMIWLDVRVGHLHFWIWANAINNLLIMKFPNPLIAQENKEGTLVQGSGSLIKRYRIGGTCLSVAHTLYMGEPSLTSPVPNFQPYDCSLKMAFSKGTQLKGSNVNICKFMNKLNKKLWISFQMPRQSSPTPLPWNGDRVQSDGLWNVGEEKKFECSFNGGCHRAFCPAVERNHQAETINI